MIIFGAIPPIYSIALIKLNKKSNTAAPFYPIVEMNYIHISDTNAYYRAMRKMLYRLTAPLSENNMAIIANEITEFDKSNFRTYVG